MRIVLTVIAWLVLATPAHAQAVQVDPPTPQPERLCWVARPCQSDADADAPACWVQTPCTTSTHPTAEAHAVVSRPRSRAVFWTGVGLLAGGATLMVGASTWWQQTPEGYLGFAPCHADPALTNRPIAPCALNRPLFYTGTALAAAGGALVLWSSRDDRIAVSATAHSLSTRLRF